MINWPTGKISTILKELEEIMIPTDGAMWNLDDVVDSVPPDEGCEVLGGEVNNEEFDTNDNKNNAYSNDAHILVEWGVIRKFYRG